MKIYLDLLLIQDTFMMFIVLFATSKITNINMNVIRLITISVLSSVVSIALLVFLPTLYDNLLIKFLISFVIVKYGFRIKEKIFAIQKTIIFWIVSLLIGGTSIFFNGNIILTLIAFIISAITIVTNRKKNKRLLLLESTICLVEFEYNNKSYNLKALIDTGHDVKSIYGEDVIFIKEKIYETGGDKNKRLVSYKTISGMESNIGIKINNIIISYGNKTFYSSAVIVSTPNILQKYDAIVGYDFIEGGMTDGNTIINETESKKIVY